MDGFGRDFWKLSRRDFSRGSLAGLAWLSSSNSLWAGSVSLLKDFKRNKPKLVLLNERPLNAESSPHLLDIDPTPAEFLFVRNNGLPPVGVDLTSWRLRVFGEVGQVREWTLAQLKKEFKKYSYQFVLECGGNGRAAFDPATRGLQWTYGGVGCPRWEGLLLKDLLEKVGVKKSAVYLAYQGLDRHLSGDPNKFPISRGIPIAKAFSPYTMLAYGMNGQDLSPWHGYPLRLLCPGYPASASGKWLQALWVRDRVHDGEKMGPYAYRVPANPVMPGAQVLPKDMKIIEEMPVKSLITFPKSGLRHKLGKKLLCRGFAWSGAGKIRELLLTWDRGQTWQLARLQPGVNPWAWQRWEAEVKFARPGYYELWSRAADISGKMQPMLVPSWNPKGYLNNGMPRIAVHVES